jgi:hypothetical protein
MYIQCTGVSSIKHIEHLFLYFNISCAFFQNDCTKSAHHLNDCATVSTLIQVLHSCSIVQIYSTGPALIEYIAQVLHSCTNAPQVLNHLDIGSSVECTAQVFLNPKILHRFAFMRLYCTCPASLGHIAQFLHHFDMLRRLCCNMYAAHVVLQLEYCTGAVSLE